MTRTQSTDKQCFHCLNPIPDNQAVIGNIGDKQRAFCCHGCLGVAQWVSESGLEQYYRVRTGAPKADNTDTEHYQQYNLPEIYKKYTTTWGETLTEITLTVEGIHCAACMWLIEKSLLQLTGTHSAEGNATTHTLHIRWDDSQTRLSELLAAIAALGYQPLLNRDGGQQERYDDIRRSSLKRLALAGLGMMQVMMYSAALYAGAWQGMSAEMKAFFQWVSFFLTTPIFFYSGFPFIHSAVNALKARHLNMDVPVALAITLAYGFSIYHLLKGQGEIYFDSVVMFVFFLSASRYLEMMGRYKAILRIAKNTALLPEIVKRATADSLSAPTNPIPIDSLEVGDYFLVSAGETIAADGEVLCGHSTVNESLLTGEARPIPKTTTQHVLAGSINQEQPLLVKATAVGQSTTLAETKRLLVGAQTQKPRVQHITDRLAAYVVALILCTTLLTYGVWTWGLHADDAFEVALSVLVATCPCALSLAVPTAYAAGANVLSQQHLLVRNTAVMDTLPHVSRAVFDKTGTLTTDDIHITRTETFTEQTEQDVLAIAAALETHIHHPIAQAFRHYALPHVVVENQHITSGKGVSGNIDGHYYLLGKATFIAEHLAGDTAKQPTNDHALLNDSNGIYLYRDNTAVARFTLSDELNTTALPACRTLQQRGVNSAIASGDNPVRVKAVADSLAISDYHAELLPQDKLDLVKSLQHRGETVLMAGDGINDAPVLAAADVAVAVGNASALSQSQADVVLLHHDLRKIPFLLTVAAKTRRIIRQNLVWAIGYNLTAIPVAVLGYLPPWVAALGMSLSSLIVLVNALRIYTVKP